MSEFNELIGGVLRSDDAWTVEITPDWKQGRTLYGGLSAALCTQAALNEWTDLPPLRSASFSFVGPAENGLKLVPTLLRRGKSTVFANVDLTSDDGLATRAVLCFGAAREGGLSHRSWPMPSAKRATDCPNFFHRAPAMLSFLQHLEGRYAYGSPPFSSGTEPKFGLWLRHRDAHHVPSVVSLLALADAPPPPTAALISAPPRAISTMTWSIDMLTHEVTSPDGWFLMEVASDGAADGYSCHNAVIWSSDGRPLMTAHQHVAVFE